MRIAYVCTVSQANNTFTEPKMKKLYVIRVDKFLSIDFKSLQDAAEYLSMLTFEEGELVEVGSELRLNEKTVGYTIKVMS